MGMDPKLVDKRVVARNLDRGRLEAKRYSEWIDALPDVSAQVWQGDGEEPESASASPAAPTEPNAPTASE